MSLQEKLKEEESTIAKFVEDLHDQIEQASKDLQEFRVLKKTFKPPKPLWPYSDDDPEVLKQKEEEERKKREEELLRKQEEERKAAEALAAEQAKAAAGGKGAKPGAAPAKAPIQPV